MGTNYYMKKSGACPCCKREHKTLHIGKSSAGWCFALHIMPERGINDLEDWQKLWNEPGTIIETEYGDQITPEEMTQVITQRSRDKSVDEIFRTNPRCLRLMVLKRPRLLQPQQRHPRPQQTLAPPHRSVRPLRQARCRHLGLHRG